MIDFNAHILTGFGDGPRMLAESSEMLRRLSALGFKKIVCAPRYVAKSDNYVSATEKRKKIRELELVAKYHGDSTKLYIANEVFLTKNIDEMVQKGEISLLGCKYILIKLPERGKISYKKVGEVLTDLRRKSYTPVLANPEKSEFIQGDFGIVDKLSGTGAMFQASFATMAGINGRKAEKLMKYMLERGFVDFLGTDVHNVDDEIFDKFDKSLKKIEKIIGKSGVDKIMRNAEGVL